MFYVLGAVSLFLLLRRLLRFRRRRKLKFDFHWAGRGWDWPSVQKGLIAFGGIGSGKTFSTEGYIRHLIRAGCPVLSTAVKVDEADRYERLCHEEGCLDRFRRIAPGTPWAIDLMTELMRNGTASDAAAFLMMLGDIEKSGNGGDNAAFWRNLEEGALRYAIRLCMLCGEPPSLDRIYNIILTAPNMPNQGGMKEQKDGYGNVVYDQNDKPVLVPVNPEYVFTTPPTDEMRMFPRLMRKLYAKLKGGDYTEYNRIKAFFLSEFCGTDKIHGSIIAGINGTLGRFIDPPLRDSLIQTTITPADIERQRLIVVIDFPIMKFHTSGRLYACIWTMLTQRHLMERSARGIEVPFVLVRDEAGWTLHAEWDAKAHNTLRSQKCADIAIVQDLNTLEAALGGGQKSHHEAMAFASNHMHKLFFGNYSADTNKWASEMSGQYKEVCISSGQQDAQDFAGRALGVKSLNWNLHYQPVVRPEHFNQLPVGHAYLMSGGSVQYVNFRGKR